MSTVTGSRRLDYLRRQRENLADEVEAVTTQAADEDRDLTDAEQTTCESRRERLRSLDAEIGVEVDLAERSAQYRELSSRVGGGPSPSNGTAERQSPSPAVPEYETPGAYLVDYLTRGKDDQARRRFGAYLERVAAHQKTTDNPGIIPEPIVGPVVGEATMLRPAFNAATSRPMPDSGIKFSRPIITQHTLVGPQAAEKTELPSRVMKIDPLEVTKNTYGGYVNLSFQNRDWTDPAILNLLISDLAGAYAMETDKAFCTYFEAAVTQTTPVATNDAKGWLGAIYAGAGMVYTADNSMPDTLWVSPDVWASLGAMVDGSGRPMFPTISPVNAFGTVAPTTFTATVAGIRLVVDANFPALTAILGSSRRVETYEQLGGQVQATEPSLLGVQIAYYGYCAWIVLQPNAFVQFTGIPPAPLSGRTTDDEPKSTKGSYSK
jgi:HK97 family phage major capsid protein